MGVGLGRLQAGLKVGDHLLALNYVDIAAAAPALIEKTYVVPPP